MDGMGLGNFYIFKPGKSVEQNLQLQTAGISAKTYQAIASWAVVKDLSFFRVGMVAKGVQMM